MGMVEDIVGAIVLIGITIGVSLIMFTQFTKISSESMRFTLQGETAEKYGGTFNSLLEITEPNSRRNFGDLLGSSLYYGNQEMRAKGSYISIIDEFKKLLDSAFPEGNYYFYANPPVRNLHLVFIIDGSDTMVDERDMLAENFDIILEDIKNKVEIGTVEGEVFVLKDVNSTWCDGFASCTYYLERMIYANSNFSLFDIKKRDHELLRPDKILKDEEVWGSDWQSAIISIALLKNNYDRTELTLFIPITDGLPSATKYSDPCPADYATEILERDKDFIIDKNIQIGCLTI